MDGKSKDLIVDNIEKIKALFPEAVNEVADKECKISYRIDMEKLSILLGDAAIPTDEVEYRQKYGEKFTFEWSGKRLAIAEAQKRSSGTLRPCPEESVDWHNTENLYIEGDNLEVLKLLQNSYMGAIKMIYIDPPYNTGKDFVYKDNYKDNLSNYLEQTNTTNAVNSEASGRYHTNWLNMMYPRLKLARNLLCEDGTIFISIDDNEQANLKKMSDEIFGEDNFVNKFIWINKKEGRQIQGSGAAGTHEEVFCYAKNIFNVSEFVSDISFLGQLMPSSYNHKSLEKIIEQDAKGRYIATHELYNGNSVFNEMTRPKLVFDIYYCESNNDIKVENVSNEHIHNGYTKISPHVNADGVHKYHAYRWSREKILRESEDLKFVKCRDSFKIFTKRRDFEITIVKDLITDIATTSGSQDLKDLLFEKYFDYPKPIKLIKLFSKITTEQNDIVLDFFSGSTTTAHAVMELNVEDGGNRKYIMVQLPELTYEGEVEKYIDIDGVERKHYVIDNKTGYPGIVMDSETRKAGYWTISQIGKERIRRAGKKIKEENKDKDGIEKLDVGFKVFKLDRSNVKNWDLELEKPKEKDAAKQLKAEFNKVLDVLKSDRSELDMLYEVILKLGTPLTAKVEEREIDGKRAFVVGNGVMVATFAKGLTYKQIGQILDMKADFINPGEFKFVIADESFANCNDKTNAVQLFKQRGITNFEII